ncbi:MAG TPA: prolyl oligopeptidase family serine peptidase [Verrucomicrobiae bacterium]|nr:prolyl oligopeptidase family serine peptidase [Verrucomicrobiae bacterium]
MSLKIWNRPGGRALLLLLAALLQFGCQRQAPPVTARKPITDEYHGVKVVDDFRWLEKSADPEVRRWTEEQNKYARGVLDRVYARAFIEQRLQRLYEATSANYFALYARTSRIFALKFKPPKQQPFLVTLTSANDVKSERIVVDPNELNANGTTAIDWYVPSHDGRVVAVSLSENGSEQGTLHIYHVDSGKKLPDEIPRVQFPTAGGSAAWNADGSGLFYTRYPRPGSRLDRIAGDLSADDTYFYQRIYFHKIGTPPEQDSYELGKEFPRIAEIALQSSDDGRLILAKVANGDGGEFSHYLRQPSGEWKQITRFEDEVKQVEFGRDPLYVELPKDDALYLLSRKGAPRGKILRMPLDQLDLAKAQTVVKQGKLVIGTFKPAASGLFIADIDGGPSQLRFYDLFEKKEHKLPLRGLYSVEQMICRRGDELLFRTVSYTEPFAWHTYDATRDRERVHATELRGSSPAEFADIEVVREFVKSKDGVKVPLNIIRKKGLHLDGQNPTILTGYGGYGMTLSPDFDFTRRVWLDQGGIIAVANLRGGGEYGEDWHRLGNLTNKQNVFDDFIACARFLIRSNYTSREKLAIEGGSNGGLLMGAALTQHPELFHAVVSHAGIYDMLHFEFDPNGAFNATEYGSVTDPAQFQALFGYSPYHRMSNGVPYPSVLLLTGEHDGRVNPAHSRKMTARLQTASSSKRPILLRTSANTGHGVGTALSARIAELSDVFAFLFDQLGMDYSLLDRGPWSGAITPRGALIKAKLAEAGLQARLLLSTDAAFQSPIYTSPVRTETNHNNVVQFSLTALKLNTQYHYALEINGRVDKHKQGEFRTFPEAPASFSFAYASCAKTASTSDVFDTIRENHPLFFMNIGDFHYLNITSNSPGKFRAAYDLVLSSPQQAELYRHIPFVYIWDDHDFGGNNSNRKASSHEAARLTYEEYVPHYPLASGDGDVPIYQTFTLGRAKFILTDLRSERDEAKKKDSPQKTMMGAKQKAWFKQELLSAKDHYPLIFWVSSVPWLGQPHTNYYRGIGTNQFGFFHHTNLTYTPTRRRQRTPTDEDHWSVYSYERTEIADFIKSNHITGLAILHGDSHMLAADDGSHSDFATGGGAPIPVMCAAPLDQEPSIKGGPYSQGIYKVRKGEGCFGLVTVTDEGNEITVSYSGRNNKNEEKISLKFKVPATNHVDRDT